MDKLRNLDLKKSYKNNHCSRKNPAFPAVKKEKVRHFPAFPAFLRKTGCFPAFPAGVTTLEFMLKPPSK